MYELILKRRDERKCWNELLVMKCASSGGAPSRRSNRVEESGLAGEGIVYLRVQRNGKSTLTGRS